MLWKKPSGTEIETNDVSFTKEDGLALGWELLEGPSDLEEEEEEEEIIEDDEQEEDTDPV